jgi:regulator of protease activity HflC (stomatin/prohibitin superfamily)
MGFIIFLAGLLIMTASVAALALKGKIPKLIPLVGMLAGLSLIVFTAIFDIERVRGGQIGVELKGQNATTFDGFNVLGPTSKSMVFDVVIPLDLDISLSQGENGQTVPGPRTIQVKDSDGQPVWLDMRVVIALNTMETDGRRAFTEQDLSEIRAWGYQFRKKGQSGLEELAVSAAQNAANLASQPFSADEMVNTDRGQYNDAVIDAVRDALLGRGFDVVDVVIQEVRLSPVSANAVEQLAKERVNQRVKTEEGATKAIEARNAQTVATETAKKDLIEAEGRAAVNLRDAKAESEALAITSEAEAERIKRIEEACGCDYTVYLQSLGIADSTGKVIYTDGRTPVITSTP